jgi:hypothetical protein
MPVLSREYLTGRNRLAVTLVLLSALYAFAFMLAPDGSLCGSSMLVNVFFLSIVDADQRLD